MAKADIGMIGLAVMGENLSLNMESKGFTVAVYNRTVSGMEEGFVERFINGRGKGKKFIGASSIRELVESLKTPRKIMMMIRAGKAVDEVIEQLLPYLDSGDIIVDGGNSLFTDTIRTTPRMSKTTATFTSVPVFPAVKKAQDRAFNHARWLPSGLALR